MKMNRTCTEPDKMEQRKRRMKRRRRTVLIQKIILFTVGILVLFFAAMAFFFQVPSFRSNYHMRRGEHYTRQKEYEKAISSYEEAIRIKNGNVQAYQCMAQIYLSMDDEEQAKQILYQAMQETEDEQILDAFITMTLNEAVYEINENQISVETLLKCAEVLQYDPENDEAFQLLKTCYERKYGFVGEDGKNTALYTDDGATQVLTEYIAFVERLLELYQKSPSLTLKEIIILYAYQENKTVSLPTDGIEAYADFLKKVSGTISYEDATQWLPCLLKALEIKEYFAPLLREFEKGNFEAAKEWIVSEDYLAIRDSFIDGSMPYWRNTTYEIVSDIGIDFYSENGKRSFSFMEEKMDQAKRGFLKVWGFRWVDNGRLRTGISYVPIHTGSDPYPYEEYEIMYWWATVKNQELTVSTYAKMNYRFEKRIYTQSGMTSEVINDWGGEYEYKDTYT